MFSFDITDRLKKKLAKLVKKDKVLAETFRKKANEVIQRDEHSIQAYKNLKSPLHEFNRIHLTDNYILLSHLDVEHQHIVFVDLVHWDVAYRR